MKSELSFLLELVLDEQIPQPVKTRLVTRIREVEKNYLLPPQPQQIVSRGTKAQITSPVIASQSPSMQRIMESNPDLIPKPPIPTNPQAASALMDRQAKINAAISGKEDKERTSPRKF